MASVSIEIDEYTKREVEILFNQLGMSINTAINIFFKQSLIENALPFQPSIIKKKHTPTKERLNGFTGVFEIEDWDDGMPVGREVL